MESYTGKGRGRVEGMDKATGRAVYAADYYEENMLHLAIVRSAYAHARVLDIDTSKVPETAWVFTAKDIVKNNVQDILPDQPLLVEDKARFLGEAIAVVAAESEEAAKAAAAMVQVTYEPLQVVTDALMAAKPGCIRVHDDTENDVIRFDNEKGNVAQGFAESDLILEEKTKIFDKHWCLHSIDSRYRCVNVSRFCNVLVVTSMDDFTELANT